MRSRRRHLLLDTAGVALALALGAVAQSNATAGTVTGQTGAAVCPFSAAELSTIVGRKLQRAALGGGRIASQCAFSAIEGGKAVAPQLYLTLDPGNAADLRDSYRYYVGARAQLATHPQAKARPDLGPAAFTLTVADAHVTNAFFLSGDNIATLSLDLSDAPRAERLVLAQILDLAVDRLA
jgi:hypothetical protein